MGYYTGSGVVTSGGSNVSTKETVYWYGEHCIFQRKTTTVTTKNGVSLSTAQGTQGSISLSNQTFKSPSNSNVWFISRGCKGTTVNVSYSRISDSNLYAMTTTSTKTEVQDQGGWTPTGWQS